MFDKVLCEEKELLTLKISKLGQILCADKTGFHRLSHIYVINFVCIKIQHLVSLMIINTVLKIRVGNWLIIYSIQIGISEMGQKITCDRSLF